MRATPRRTQHWFGPVVVSLAAAFVVLLSGLAVNGCHISKLLSSASTGAGGDGGGVIIVVPSLVRDSAIAGTSTPRETDVSVTNGGRWAASTDDDWIHVSPASGGSRATLKVSLNPKELTPGLHRGAVTLREDDDADNQAMVFVNFLIQQPVLEVDPGHFDFRPSTSNTVYHDTIYVTNEGTGPLVWFASTEDHAGWLTFESDTTGTAPSALAIRASNEGLSYFGTHKETIIITSPGAKNSPQKIEVTMRRRRGGGDDDSGTP
ncbi:MAG TPA: hypothetical protein VFO67_10300 [Gemmatimonadales bacterium]|nr:hypothetical protein [Gemmatimonadales bacterium]